MPTKDRDTHAPVWVALLTAGAFFACGGAAPEPAPPVQAPSTTLPPSEAAPSARQTPTSSGEEAAPSKASDGASEENTFALRDSDQAESAQGATESKIKPTKTEAALKFIVVDKDKGPLPGIVISLTAPNGAKFYTAETDATGYTEVLVPVAHKYSLVYLSLGRRDIAATVPVSAEPNQNIKLTLRYKRNTPKLDAPPRFVLDGVNFDTGKATLRPESFPRLDTVLEYMLHKKSARIQISGHTDSVGNRQDNKLLSERRASACRDYLISKGIDASRIEAVGYGDERPIASNEDAAGRQANRRIEAMEL